MEYWCIDCKWCLLVFFLSLLSDENLHSLLEVGWTVFSPESTPLVIQQSPLTRKFIDLCRGSCLCLCLSVYLFMSLLLLFFFKPSFTDSVFYFRFHDSVSSIISCLGDEAKRKNTPDRRLVTVNSFVLFAWRRIAKRFFFGLLRIMVLCRSYITKIWERLRGIEALNSGKTIGRSEFISWIFHRSGFFCTCLSIDVVATADFDCF